jgi:hypothetical protein
MYQALYDESATFDQQVATYQSLINSGTAWRLEGHVGRTAMMLIEDGLCALGPKATTDYYGNVIPGRDDVQPGTKGSVQFVEDHGNVVLDGES